MSKATAYANAHKDDEEEKKVVGQQQKTQSQSSQPTGTTSIPKDNSRTQQSTASSLRTENNVTTAKQPQRETSKTTIYRQSDVPKQETKQTTMQSIKDYAKENYKLTPRQVSAKSNRIPDASVLPTASEVMGSGFKQSNNLNQYITSGQKFTPQTNSRQRAEEELENRLHNRDQLRNVGNTNTFKSLLSGAGAGALGTIGDLAGLAEKMSQNKSNEGMTPDEIYNRAMNTGRSWDNVYGNNIGSDYEAYKDYVLKQMESGAVTQDELRKMQDLEDKYSKNPAHYLSELGKDARAMNEGYSEGHKISNVAGQMIPMLLGNFAVGAVTAPEIAAAEAINNPAVRFAAQQGVNLLPDVATDTIPEVLRNINEGKSADEVAKDAAKNLALNEAANLGFEYLPKGIKALADQTNASNMAKRAVNTVPDVVEPIVKQTPVEEAAEQIVKAAEAPKNVDNVVKAATETPLNRIRGNLPIYNLADRELGRIAEAGGASDALEGAYDKLAQALDTNNADEAARAIAEYAEAAKASGIDVNKSLSRLAQYTSGNYGIDVDKAENGLYVVSKLNDELGTISRLDLTPTARKHLDTAYNQLDEYEDALVKGENTLEISEKLEKTLENLHRNAKKAEDYNGDLGRYSEGTNRGLLRYNDNYLDQPSQFTKEEQDSVLKLLGVDSEESNIPNGRDLPKGDTNIPAGGTTPPNRGPKDPLVDTNDVKERGYARTTRNNPDVPDELAAEFVETPELYNVLHNKETRANADAVLSQDFDKAYSDFKDMLNRKDPTAIPVGYDLAKKMIDKGDVDGAAELIRDMSRELTKAGQFSQAAAMTIMRGDPMTALRYAEKEIDSLNAAGAKKFGSKWKDFKLTEDEIKAFNNLNAGDTEGISKLYSQIGTRLGKDYPTTFLDKLLEARRIGMLFNPRTNIRNFAANVPTLALRWASDRVDAVGQNIAHIIKPDFEVTQSLTGSGIKGRKMAKEIFEGDKVQSLLKGTSGKYKDANIKSSLIQEKQIFKGTGLEKWIDKMTGNGLQRLNAAAFGKNGVQSIPETIRNATYKALDLGDSPFVKENFIERLGSYIKAQGYKSVDEIPDEAIETAWEAAMKATYKDESWAYKMIRDIKQGIQQAGKPGKVIGESLIPFVQAPGNIAARMVDYSPIGGINGIKNILNGAKNGNEKIVREGINQLAQGATGNLALGIGVALYNSGLITGAYSQDKDKKAHEKNNGFREYALHIGNNYYTLDWAQPAFQTIMNGVVLADAIKKSDEYDSEILKAFGVEGSLPGKLIGASKKAATTSVNSWFNASPLQSVQELLGGTYNDASDIAAKLWETVGEDFVNSYVPAALNAFTKATDLTQRQTYDPSNAIRSEINQLKAKIPGLSETLPAKYDTWGRELKTAESHGKAAFNKFINPGEGTYDKSEPIDKEINRLFDETGNNSVYPQVAPNKLGNDKLTAEQVSALQRSMGEKAYEVANELINDKNYKSFSDDIKANSFKQLYDATNALAKLQISDPETYKKIMAGDEDAIANNLDGLTRVYAEGGAKGLIDEITYKNVLKKTGMNDNDKARQIYESAKSRYDAEQKLYDLRHYQDWYKTEGFSKSTDRLESIYNSDASEEEKLNELKNYSAFKDISEEMDIGESGAREEIFNELGEEGYREFAGIYKKAQEASGLKADGSKQLTNAGAIKALKDLPSEQQEKYAPYLITNPGKNASQAQKDYPNGLYKYYMYKNEADKDGNGSVSSDESKAYFNSKSMPQGEKAYWDMSIRGSNKSNFGIPTLGNASTSTTSSTKLKETGDATLDARIKSKQNWKNNQASLDAAKNQSSTDIPTAGVDKNWYVESGGQTYDLHSTKTYERAKSAGISDDEFLKAFKGADIDGNGKIKKSEATAYINALTNLTKEQKRTWFDVLVTRKSKNPY